MRDATRDIIIGFTAIGGALATAWLMFRFGELQLMQEPRYAIEVGADHASGLREGSSVELNGIPIGVVESLRLDEHDALPVRLVLAVDEGTAVPASVRPLVRVSVFGGASVLEFEGTGGPYLPTNGSARIDGPLRVRLLDEVQAQFDRVAEPLARALDGIDGFTMSATRLVEDLDRLVAAPADGAGPGVAATLVRLDRTLARIEAASAAAEAWLADEALRADAREAAARAVSVLDALEIAVGRVAQTAGTIEARGDAVAASLMDAADRMALAADEAAGVARLAREGDGTIGLLLTNPDLYLSLLDASQRLEQALREARLLAEKIKAEGVKIGM